MTLDTQKPTHGTPERSEIEVLSQYFLLLWRWAWLIALVGIAAAGIAYLVMRLMIPVYQTSATLLVMDGSLSNVEDYGSVQSSQSLVGTYSELLTEDALLNEVIARLNLTTDSTTLAKSIEVTPVRTTQRIVIGVKGTDQAQITSIANMLSQVLVEKVQQIQQDRLAASQDRLQTELQNVEGLLQVAETNKASAKTPADAKRYDDQITQYRDLNDTLLENFRKTRLEELQTTLNVIPISPAGLSFTVVSPKTLLFTALIFLAGMAFTAGAVLVRAALDKTIRTPQDVSEKLNVPLVGVVYQHDDKSAPILQVAPGATAAESLRFLASKIQYTGASDPLRTIMVTSPNEQDAKTSVSTNLALALAQFGNCVTLVDVDFNHPAVHSQLGLNNSKGVQDVLSTGQAGLLQHGILQKSSNDNLVVLTAGEKTHAEHNLHLTQGFSGILEGLLKMKQLVVVNSAPVAQSSETIILSTMVDGVLLVVRAGQVTLAQAQQAIENLQWVNAKVIGVVLYGVDAQAARRGQPSKILAGAQKS